MENQSVSSGDCKTTPAAAGTNELHNPVEQTQEESPVGSSTSATCNKIKLQQQQQQQLQYHQFRTPQQFVRHRKTFNTTLLGGKKNKIWNKRQSKTNKQLQQSEVDGSFMDISGAGLSGSMVPLKADVENIQSHKSQIGGIHNYYSHRSSNNGSGTSTRNGLEPPALMEKFSHGHGHLKQQLYKNALSHQRGHHHHVLCAGVVHNSNTILSNDPSESGAPGRSVDNIVGGNCEIIGSNGVGCSDGGHSSCCSISNCNNTSTAQNVLKKDVSCTISNASTSSIGGPPALPMHFCCGRSKFFLPDKRPRKEIIIPPTKFLLGGNISDPLNLTSLQNEMASATSSNNNTPVTTPRQSPITTPPKVEVIIPPNIHDPLHLLDPVDSMEYEKQLTSPLKKRLSRGNSKQYKHPHRYRKNRKPKRRRNDSLLLLPPSFNASDTVEESSALPVGTLPAKAFSSISKNIVVDTGAEVLTKGVTNIEFANSSDPTLSSVQNLDSNTTASGDIATNRGTTTANITTKSNLHLGTILSPTKVAPHSPQSCSHALSAISGVSNIKAGEPLTAVAGCDKLLLGELGKRKLHLDLHTTTTRGSLCSPNSGELCGGGTGNGVRKRKISESNNSLKNKKFHRDAMDKIVSPVVPQPGAWKRPPRNAPSGARKPSTRRSTSFSETEFLSPVDDDSKTLVIDGAKSCMDSSNDMKRDGQPKTEVCNLPCSLLNDTTAKIKEQNTYSPNSTEKQLKTKTLGDFGESNKNITKSAELVSEVPTPQLRHTPKFSAEGAKYRYGNYDRYAGFRHLNEYMDVRLQVFQRNMDLFQNKDILDIGCNVGHMTITIAQNFAPKTILGIDIDKEQIARARRNLALYVRIPSNRCSKLGNAVDTSCLRHRNFLKPGKRHLQQDLQQPQFYHTQNMYKHNLRAHSNEFFPISFPLTYGSLPAISKRQKIEGQNKTSPPSSQSSINTNAGQSISGKAAESDTNHSSLNQAQNEFPRNVFFRCMNYVLKDESQLSNESQQYDVILCLSVTKWIQLNFGDAGLKLAFKRMFNQLRPGGKLILEAQNWASYKKKKNLTEEIYKNYRNIEFFPNKFHEYLLSSEVGFSHSFTLDVPRHLNKGFCRPIQLYAKGDYTPNHVRWSDAYYPQTPYEAYRGIYATMPPRPLGRATGTYPISSSTRSQAYDTPNHLGGTSGSYSCRQTPMYQPTSQYYNPLETDSYQPSYDIEYLNHMYVFASPLYQTVWSPPASLRNSSSHTPLFGSVRDAELDGDGSGGGGSGSGSSVQRHRHVYPPNDDTSSPNANADGAFNSIRDPDTDDSNQLPAGNLQHVYATNCGENSSSPQVLHHHHVDGDEITLMLDGDDQSSTGNTTGFGCI